MMQRITLTAFDYGLTFGIDRAICSLLEIERLSAVGCLVASELWSREYKPLEEQLEGRRRKVKVGLTLAFAGLPEAPCSAFWRSQVGNVLPSPRSFWIAAATRQISILAMRAEISAQISRFMDELGREPDFIAVHGDWQRWGFVAGPLLQEMKAFDFKKTPALVQPEGATSRAMARLARNAAQCGISLWPRAPGLPLRRDPDELHVDAETCFRGLQDLAVVACLPALADARLRRMEKRHEIETRACHYAVLSSDRFFRTLVQREVFLS